MSDLTVEVRHGCGLFETVTEPSNGQTLGGTAADVAARHEAICGCRGDCTFNYTFE